MTKFYIDGRRTHSSPVFVWGPERLRQNDISDRAESWRLIGIKLIWLLVGTSAGRDLGIVSTGDSSWELRGSDTKRKARSFGNRRKWPFAAGVTNRKDLRTRILTGRKKTETVKWNRSVSVLFADILEKNTCVLWPQYCFFFPFTWWIKTFCFASSRHCGTKSIYNVYYCNQSSTFKTFNDEEGDREEKPVCWWGTLSRSASEKQTVELFQRLSALMEDDLMIWMWAREV